MRPCDAKLWKISLSYSQRLHQKESRGSTAFLVFLRSHIFWDPNYFVKFHFMHVPWLGGGDGSGGGDRRPRYVAPAPMQERHPEPRNRQFPVRHTLHSFLPSGASTHCMQPQPSLFTVIPTARSLDARHALLECVWRRGGRRTLLPV